MHRRPCIPMEPMGSESAVGNKRTTGSCSRHEVEVSQSRVFYRCSLGSLPSDRRDMPYIREWHAINVAPPKVNPPPLFGKGARIQFQAKFLPEYWINVVCILRSKASLGGGFLYDKWGFHIENPWMRFACIRSLRPARPVGRVPMGFSCRSRIFWRAHVLPLLWYLWKDFAKKRQNIEDSFFDETSRTALKINVKNVLSLTFKFFYTNIQNVRRPHLLRRAWFLHSFLYRCNSMIPLTILSATVTIFASHIFWRSPKNM